MKVQRGFFCLDCDKMFLSMADVADVEAAMHEHMNFHDIQDATIWAVVGPLPRKDP